MVRGDQTSLLEGGEAPGPNTGNKTFDRKYKRHSEAIKDFSVRQKSGIETGIVYERGCTDFFFLILFIVSFLAMFGLAIYALSSGKPAMFYAPYDADGNMCGFDINSVTNADYTTYPNLYFTKLTIDADVDTVTRSGVCMKTCPKTPEEVADATWWTTNCLKNSIVDCPKPLDATNYQAIDFVTYCLPVPSSDPNDTDYVTKLKNKFLDSEAGKVVTDMTGTWKTLVSILFTGMIVSMLFMWLMSNCARCLALVAIGILLLSFFGGGAACLFAGMTATNGANTGLMVTGGCLLLMGLCTLCALWCNRTSLETAIAIIDASADFFIDTKRLIAVAVMYFFVSMIIFIMWLGALACVVSLSTFTAPAVKGDQLKTITPDGKVYGMMIFLAVVMLWTFQFIGDKTKYITMVSAATYYFSCNANKNGSASVCTAFKFAYFKNAGSIALGSFILTLVGILRAIVETMAESANENGDGAAKLIACIAKCLMACLEAIIEHLTKLAYAYMAVSGDSFCSSAWNGFILNLKHLAKFIFALKIAGLFIFMGVLTITCANTGIGYLLSMYVIKDAATATTIVPSLISFAVVSFLVAIIFLGQFDEAVMATLVCFAVDSDLHDGEPKFGPKSYHEKLGAIYGYDPKGGNNHDYDKVHNDNEPQTGAQPGAQNQMY